jgi:hypothetical protein
MGEFAALSQLARVYPRFMHMMIRFIRRFEDSLDPIVSHPYLVRTARHLLRQYSIETRWGIHRAMAYFEGQMIYAKAATILDER